jgi:LPXTG-motif cell wall-anchored protein
MRYATRAVDRGLLIAGASLAIIGALVLTRRRRP